MEHAPLGDLVRILRKSRFIVFLAYFRKMVVYIYIFLEVPGHFFTENAFMERHARGIQKPTWEPPTPWGTRVMAARSFNFNGKPEGRPTKKTQFPAIFGTFPILMYFWRGNPGASKNPGGTSQTAVVLEIWPPEVSISLENMREDRKPAIFSTLGFQTLESQKKPTKRPLPSWSFDRALSFFGVYQRP